MTDQVWEFRVGVFCSAAQVHELADRLEHALCPEPDGAPPGVVPWTMSHWPLGAREAVTAYPELIEHVRIERAG